MTLPISKKNTDNPAVAVPSHAAERRPLRILIAEDEGALLLSLSFFLRARGWMVTAVRDGEQAWEHIQEVESAGHPFDIAVVDIMMPRLNGLELMDELTRHRIELPVIVITGHAQEKLLLELLRRSCDDFIEKPFDPAVLLKVVEGVLGRRRVQADIKSRQLWETEERLNLVVAATHEGVWDLEFDKQHFYMSARMVDMFGFDTQGELPGRLLLRRLVSRRGYIALWKAYRAHAEGRTDSFICDMALRNVPRWVRVTGRIVARDSAGRILRVVGSCQDVTEQQQLEAQKTVLTEEVVESRNILEAMFAIGDPTLLLQPDLTVVKVNKSVSRYTHVAEAACVGRKCYELLGRSAPCVDCLVLTVLQTEKAVTKDRYLPELNAWFYTSATPIFDAEGTLKYVVEQGNDISHRKEAMLQLEQSVNAAQSAEIAKQTFLDLMTHELRTPVNGVLGMLELLQGCVKDERQLDLLEVCHHSARKLADVMDNLMLLVEMEANKFSMKNSTFDVRMLIKLQIRRIAERTEAKGLRIETVIPEEFPPRITTCERSVRNVVYNLIDNAVKFTHEGGVRIMLHHESTPFGVKQLVIIVSDTGIGIPEDMLNQVLERFVQVDMSHTRKYGGMGIGLSICQSLADSMNGSIYLKRNDVGGIDACFSIPLDE